MSVRRFMSDFLRYLWWGGGKAVLQVDDSLIETGDVDFPDLYCPCQVRR